MVVRRDRHGCAGTWLVRGKQRGDNASRRPEKAQRVGAVRYARQRLGVVRRTGSPPTITNILHSSIRPGRCWEPAVCCAAVRGTSLLRTAAARFASVPRLRDAPAPTVSASCANDSRFRSRPAAVRGQAVDCSKGIWLLRSVLFPGVTGTGVGAVASVDGCRIRAKRKAAKALSKERMLSHRGHREHRGLREPRHALEGNPQGFLTLMLCALGVLCGSHPLIPFLLSLASWRLCALA